MRPVAYNTLQAGHRSRIHGKWVGFRNSGHGWDAIDPRFRNDGSAFDFSAGPFRFHAPQFANQTATLEVNNRWDILSRSSITTPAMTFEITPENIQPVAGRIDDNNPSQVWYDNAWGPGLSLRYTVWHGRAPRATREAVIDPQLCPQGRDLQASWLVRSPRALTLINGARPKNPDGSDWTGAIGDRADLPETGAAIHLFDGQVDPVRGSGFKGPQVWYWQADGTLVTAPAQVTAEIVTADTIRLTKTIPQAIIDAAAAEGSLVLCDDTQTIYPDPHIEITTWDGQVGSNNATWATVIAGTDLGYYNSNITIANCSWSNTNTYFRAITLFDASALAGQTVTDATWYATKSGGYSRIQRLTGATTASNTGHSASDYQNTYLNNDTSYADGILIDDAHLGTSLNAAGISWVQAAVDGTGIIKLSFRATEDYIGATTGPGKGPDTTGIYTAESANDPYLELTYGAAGGGTDPCSTRRRMLRMVHSCDSKG